MLFCAAILDPSWVNREPPRAPLADLAPLMGFDALLQARVVQIAEGAEHLRQRRFLRRCGEHPELERTQNWGYGLVSHGEVPSHAVRGVVGVSSTGDASIYTPTNSVVQRPCAALARGPAFRRRKRAPAPSRR